MEKTKRKFTEKLRDRYRLVVLNEDSLEDVWYVVLSRRNIMAWLGVFGVILIIIGIVLVSFTPLREYIPGYPDGNIRWVYVQNALKVDSLEHQIHIRDQYLLNIRSILQGKPTSEHINVDDTVFAPANIQIKPQEFDSTLKLEVEQAQRYHLANRTINNGPEEKFDLNKMHFYCPLKGNVSNTFNAQTSHYAIDIVSNLNEPILSVLDGTVILAGWTLEAGYIIQVQHKNDLVSVYKHNSQLLKKMGDKVRAGEAIAIIGNTGEYTTGPHLHFELWHKGKAINPQDYIVF